MSPGRTGKEWSRGRDLNPRPADFSTNTMLLDSRALFLTLRHVLAWFSACFVQKLFRSFFLQREACVVVMLQKLNFKANWIIRGLLLVEMMRPKLPAVSTCPVVASIWPPEATRAFRLLMGLAKFG